MKHKIKNIIFDLDDTLYLERDFVKSGFKAVSDHVAEKYGYKQFFDIAWSLFVNGEKGNIFNLTLDKLHVEYNDEFILKLVKVYKNHSPDIQLQNDVKNFFANLNGKYSFGMITDGNEEIQKRKLEKLGLATKFSIFVANEPETFKPHPSSFEKMETFFKGDPSEYVYIGDNLKKDFLCPNQRGWKTIMIDREEKVHKSSFEDYSGDYLPDIIMEDFTKLIEEV